MEWSSNETRPSGFGSCMSWELRCCFRTPGMLARPSSWLRWASRPLQRRAVALLRPWDALTVRSHVTRSWHIQVQLWRARSCRYQLIWTNGFADDPTGVAETIGLALEAGLAGCSVEDFTGRLDSPIYDARLAEERVVAAAEVAHGGPVRLMLTARAENHLHGCDDLADTIARLQRYQEAGADVLFAPGVTRLEDVRQLVISVDRPVSVLALRGSPTVTELAAVGVRRISVGGAFAFAALGAAAEAAREFRERGTYGYWDRAVPGAKAARAAFRV